MPVEAMATYLNSKWDPNTLLYVCRERSGGQPLFQVLQGDWGVDAGEKKTGKATGYRPQAGLCCCRLASMTQDLRWPLVRRLPVSVCAFRSRCVRQVS